MTGIQLDENPFTVTVLTHRLQSTCSHCLATPSPPKLLRCSKCKFMYYCNDECQKRDWNHHKKECQRIRRFHSIMDDKGSIRRFPPGLIKEGKEELMLSFPDEALRLVARLMDVWDRSETKSYESGGRKLGMLETHVEEIEKNRVAMEQFKRICAQYEYFCTGDGSGGGHFEYDKSKLFNLYGLCRSNAFCIKDSKLESVGIGIFVNLRRIRHSCNPNARIVFQGRMASVVILVDPDENGDLIRPVIDSYDQITCSYMDSMMPRKERRSKLKEMHFFDCHCDLCEDDGFKNEMMDGLRCDSVEGCDGVVVWMEKTGDDDDGEYKCLQCGKLYEDKENADTILKLTKEILDSPQTKQRALEEPWWAKEVYANLACMQMPTFHLRNVYRIRAMKESYETACRLGNWADASSYGKETLDGFKKYLNEYSDPEYGMVAVNVAKAHINHNWNVKEALEILRICRRGLGYAYGSESEQCKEIDGLIKICESVIEKGGPEKMKPEATVEELKLMLDKMFGKVDV